jgi:hypothetical protein
MLQLLELERIKIIKKHRIVHYTNVLFELSLGKRMIWMSFLWKRENFCNTTVRTALLSLSKSWKRNTSIFKHWEWFL